MELTLTGEWRPHRCLRDRQELLIGNWLATVRPLVTGASEWGVVGAITGNPIADGVGDTEDDAKTFAEQAIRDRVAKKSA